MQRMRIVRGGAAVNRCVSVSSLKLLNNLQLFSMIAKVLSCSVCSVLFCFVLFFPIFCLIVSVLFCSLFSSV